MTKILGLFNQLWMELRYLVLRKIYGPVDVLLWFVDTDLLVCCAEPVVQSEYLLTEVCRCLTGRASKQSDYTHSAAVVIHHIVEVGVLI